MDASETTCVVHFDSLLAVSALVDDAPKFNLFTLSALEAVLEALILYDRLIVYENTPSRLLLELASAESRLYGYDAPENLPFPFIYRLHEEDCLGWGNAYTLEEAKADAPHRMDYPSSYQSTSGKIVTPLIGGIPDDIRDRGRERPLDTVESIARKSLQHIQWTGLPEHLVPGQRELFIKDYASTQMFELDAARELSNHVAADSLLISTPAKSFYGAEQDVLRSALEQKFMKVEEDLARMVTETGVTFDHSPLLAVALDTTLEREMLIDTIFQMRKDYRELRAVGRKYKSDIRGAQSYGQRSDVIREWNQDWEKTLSSIGEKQIGLPGRVFSWDVVKKGSVKGALIESAGKVLDWARDVQIAPSLRVVHRFTEEFTFSRPIEKRIEELFGGLDRSPWSPWQVMTIF